jgi:hypothetical protein
VTAYPIWPGIIPGGAVMLVAGTPTARAHIMADVAARLSTGAAFADGARRVYDEGDACGPTDVLTFTANPQAFLLKFRAYGGDNEYLKLGKLGADSVKAIGVLEPSLVVVDPIPNGLTSDKRIRAFLSDLRAQKCAVMLGTNISTRQQVGGSAAWQEADGCLRLREDGNQLTLEHMNGSLVMDVTKDGLRNGRAPEEEDAESRKSYSAGLAEGWLMCATKDGQKRSRADLVTGAAEVGIKERHLKSAFEAIPGMKFERTATVPSVTLWWREPK